MKKLNKMSRIIFFTVLILTTVVLAILILITGTYYKEKTENIIYVKVYQSAIVEEAIYSAWRKGYISGLEYCNNAISLNSTVDETDGCKLIFDIIKSSEMQCDSKHIHYINK
jgi:hypothetical protein